MADDSDTEGFADVQQPNEVNEVQQQLQRLIQANQALQEQLNQLVQQQNVANQAAQQPQQLNQAPANGILVSPWQGELDLTTKLGKSLWDEGIKPLQNKFSGYGKDVVRFLADISNRSKKCYWQEILTFNNKDLLTQYGEIPLADIIAERDARNTVRPTTLAEARPKINASMMFHFLYESIGTYPQKQLSTKLDEIGQDGPTLLKIVLINTFIGTKASTFTIKEKFYDLNLKKYRWNVISMNADIREKLADLMAAGSKPDENDTVIMLFRAYQTTTNDEFLRSVGFWKDQWTANQITSVEQLMQKAAEKYDELRTMGTWGKKTQDDQIVALNAKIEELKNNNKENNGSDDKKKDGWRYDRSASSKTTLNRNGKTYHWCTGPGHGNKPMWTIHLPGKCTDRNYKNPKKEGATTALAAQLKAQGLSDDEITSKVEAITAIMES